MTKIYPVIHYQDAATSRDQAAIALEHGSDGVFLISHNDEDKAVLQVAGQLRHAWGSATTAAGELPFIGVNLLNTNNPAALEFAAQLRLDGVWLDAPGVNSHGPSQRTKKFAEDMAKYPGVAVFGSVAFKYQPDEPNPPEAARAALALNMIPTTSGSGTGMAPELSKIALMSKAVDGRLAVASGMTLENVAAYVPYLSHILVATGVSLDKHRFDPQRLARFVAAVRAGSSA